MHYSQQVLLIYFSQEPQKSRIHFLIFSFPYLGLEGEGLRVVKIYFVVCRREGEGASVGTEAARSYPGTRVSTLEHNFHVCHVK